MKFSINLKQTKTTFTFAIFSPGEAHNNQVAIHFGRWKIYARDRHLLWLEPNYDLSLTFCLID